MYAAHPYAVPDEPGTGSIALCDESMRRDTGTSGVYLLSSVIVPQNELSAVRERMSGLRLPGQRKKLHWRDESASRRALAADGLAALRADIVIATWCGMSHDKQERARRGQPAVVIGRMMQSEWGIQQLMATVRASREDLPFPRLDPEGNKLPDEATPNTPSYNNDWLRERVLKEDLTTPVTAAEEPEKVLFESVRAAWDAFEHFRELKDPPYYSLSDDKWRDAAKTAGRLAKNIDKYVREED